MTVAVIRAESPQEVRRAIELLGGMGRFVSPGDKVLVKPNICAAKSSDTGAVTDPELVAEVCRMAAAEGAEVTVGESPIHPFRSSRVFPRAGYGDFRERYGFPLIDLDTAEKVEIRIPGGVAVKEEVVARPVLECDALINVPVMKTHLQTVVSLGLKNLKGVVPTRDKLIIHLHGLDQGIVDLNTVIRSRLVVVDGLVGMEGALGPTNGRPVRLGTIVAGDNVVEVDATCARIMGADPREITHIRLAAERGLGRLEGFEVLGDGIEAVRRKLELPTRPDLNRLMISGILLRIYDLLRRPLDRLAGRAPSFRFGEVRLDAGRCDGCRICVKACPVEAVSMRGELPSIDDRACIACFCCAEACPRGALSRA
ncbi:MAG: DUF362 domain-containing protein [Actinomycetota bacterium]|nr:DUF362 domain-containing protein [Actinomycetota bacterium]MDI7252784.1 DUF362 domain-containing protein [Actinomycetota bacterium]